MLSNQAAECAYHGQSSCAARRRAISNSARRQGRTNRGPSSSAQLAIGLFSDELNDFGEGRPVSTGCRNPKFFLNEVIRKAIESIAMASRASFDESKGNLGLLRGF